MIELSKTAASEIRRLQDTHQQPNAFLRLSIRAGGCSGFYYILDFDQQIEEGDRSYESHGISVLLDRKTQGYLKNLKLDYSEDLMGGGFRFHNPQATATCDCGQSFSLESQSL